MIMKPLAHSERNALEKVSPQLTIYYPRLVLIFREGSVSLIKQAKGYRRDAELARALNISKAYLSAMKAGNKAVSDEIIVKIAYLLNNFDNWHIYYRIVQTGNPLPPNHPLWNQGKHDGVIPYDRYSLSAEFRRKDYPAESNC